MGLDYEKATFQKETKIILLKKQLQDRATLA